MSNLTYLRKSLVMGLIACVLVPGTATADKGDYVYKQKFMPTQTMELDLSKTAFFVTDPQNDFLSEGSPAWGLVGPTVIKNEVVTFDQIVKRVKHAK